MEAGDALARIQIPYQQLILGIEAYQPVRAELEIGKGARPRRGE